MLTRRALERALDGLERVPSDVGRRIRAEAEAGIVHRGPAQQRQAIRTAQAAIRAAQAPKSRSVRTIQPQAPKSRSVRTIQPQAPKSRSVRTIQPGAGAAWRALERALERATDE